MQTTVALGKFTDGFTPEVRARLVWKGASPLMEGTNRGLTSRR